MNGGVKIKQWCSTSLFWNSYTGTLALTSKCWSHMSIVVVMALMVKLPDSVACDILSNWLPAKALSKLDNAYCNHDLRKAFLELLQDLHVPGIHAAHLCRPKYMNRMQWINTRLVKCTSFNYQTTYTDIPLSEADVGAVNAFFRHQAAHLLSIHISSSDCATTSAILLRAMQESNCCVSKLSVSSPSVHEISVYLVTNLSNSAAVLSELDLRCSVAFANSACTLKLPHLVKLRVENTTDADLLNISVAVSNVLVVTLSNPFCSHIGLTAIAQHCPTLQSFTMFCGEKSIVSRLNEGLATIARQCRNLQVLHLDSCRTLTDFGLNAVVAHCTQLIELAVCGNRRLTDAPLIALAHSAASRTLQVLNVTSCAMISGAGIVAIATHCKSLHTLDVTFMNTLSRAHMCEAVLHLQNVHTLRCGSNTTDIAFLHKAAENLPLLSNLDIRANSAPHQYTLSVVTVVVEKCEKLTRLHLAENPGTFSGETIQQWKAMRPGLLVSFPQYKTHRY